MAVSLTFLQFSWKEVHKLAGVKTIFKLILVLVYVSSNLIEEIAYQAQESWSTSAIQLSPHVLSGALWPCQETDVH